MLAGENGVIGSRGRGEMESIGFEDSNPSGAEWAVLKVPGIFCGNQTPQWPGWTRISGRDFLDSSVAEVARKQGRRVSRGWICAVPR